MIKSIQGTKVISSSIRNELSLRDPIREIIKLILIKTLTFSLLK